MRISSRAAEAVRAVGMVEAAAKTVGVAAKERRLLQCRPRTMRSHHDVPTGGSDGRG